MKTYKFEEAIVLMREGRVLNIGDSKYRIHVGMLMYINSGVKDWCFCKNEIGHLLNQIFTLVPKKIESFDELLVLDKALLHGERVEKCSDGSWYYSDHDCLVGFDKSTIDLSNWERDE